MKRNILFISLFISCLIQLKGQELPNPINVIPPSPNVSAMNKFVEVPVGHYTGTPNISVPIYQIQMQQLSLPISLDYHASGLKVEEYASWVGAGWSLNAGGSISRTVRGLPDEYMLATNTSSPGKKGYFFNDKLFLSSGEINNFWLDNAACDRNFSVDYTQNPASTYDSLAQGYLDTEPDLYTFNSPAGSGKFVFSRSGNVQRFSKDDVKIIDHPFDGTSFPILAGSPSSTDYNWVIQGPDGIQYKYSNSERTTTFTSCGASPTQPGSPIVRGHESAWHLEEISLNGEWIRFEYVQEEIQYNMKLSTSGKYKIGGTLSGGEGLSSCINFLEVKTKRLSRIHTSNGLEVKFIATQDRLDLPGSKRLERIEVRKDEQPVKFYRLQNNDYFGSNTKLKLNQVFEENEPSTNSLPGYQFEYYGSVPSINSNSQDFWGFYNGAGNPSGMIPAYKSDYYHVNASSTVNRNPSLGSARAGTLNKVIYPTGGYSNFEYELNEYFDASHKKTYIHYISASGGSEEEETEEGGGPPIDPTDIQTYDFTVAQNASATLTIVSSDEVGSYARLQDQSGNTVNLSSKGNRRNLPAGSYRLYARSENGQVNSIRIEYEQEEATNVLTGGLRVKTISMTDPSSNKVIKKSYEYTSEGSGNSSGKLFSPIIIGGNIVTYTDGVLNSPIVGTCTPGSNVISIEVKSMNQLPSAIYHGSHIGYSRVREFSGASGTGVGGANEYLNGATDYEFINEVPSLNNAFPYVPSVDLSHKNGKVLKQYTHKQTEGVLTPVRLIENQYTIQHFTSERVYGMAFSQPNTSFCYDCSMNPYSYNSYETEPVWHYLSSTTETSYDDNGAPHSVVTNYGYNTSSPVYYMPLSKSFTDSKGDVYRTDYSRQSGTPALITNASTYRVISGGSDEKVSGQSFTYYGKLPATIAQWNGIEGAGSLDIPKLKYAFGTASTLQEVEEFPISGGTGSYGTKSAYIWGYNNAYPIAQVVNAAFDDIAFSSFEGSHKGNWTYAGTVASSVTPFSGAKYYSLSTGNVTKSGLTSNTKYVVSYWAKDGTPSVTGVISSRDVVYTNGDGWKYYEKIVSGVTSLTISGTAKIDELRLHPLGAQMTSFTYQPGYGVSSQTTANGSTSFYVYDDFGRLEMIKDREGNILKVFEYAYQQTIPSTQQN